MADLYIPKAPDITTPFQNMMRLGLAREGQEFERKKQKRLEDRQREEAALKRKDADYKTTQDFLFKKHDFLSIEGKGKNIEAITKAYNEYTGQNLQPNTAQYEQFDEWKKRWQDAIKKKASQEIKNDLWQEGLSIFTIPEIKTAQAGLREETTGVGKIPATKTIAISSTMEREMGYNSQTGQYDIDIGSEARPIFKPTEAGEQAGTKEKRQWSNDARRALVTSMGGKIDAQGSFLFSAGTEETGDLAMQLLGDYTDLSPNRAAIAAKKQAERMVRELPDATKHAEGTQVRDKETGLMFQLIDGEWTFIGK